MAGKQRIGATASAINLLSGMLIEKRKAEQQRQEYARELEQKLTYEMLLHQWKGKLEQEQAAATLGQVQGMIGGQGGYGQPKVSVDSDGKASYSFEPQKPLTPEQETSIVDSAIPGQPQTPYSHPQAQPIMQSLIDRGLGESPTAIPTGVQMASPALSPTGEMPPSPTTPTPSVSPAVPAGMGALNLQPGQSFTKKYRGGTLTSHGPDLKQQQDIAAQQRKDALEQRRQQAESDFIKESALDTLATIDEVERGIRNFGLTGQIPSIPGTERAKWEANVNKLLAGKVISLLSEMKKVSKTGASGFGQLSQKELMVLQDASTALKRTLKPEDAQAILTKMRTKLQKIAQLDASSESPANQQGGGAVPTGSSDQRAEQWLQEQGALVTEANIDAVKRKFGW